MKTALFGFLFFIAIPLFGATPNALTNQPQFVTYEDWAAAVRTYHTQLTLVEQAYVKSGGATKHADLWHKIYEGKLLPQLHERNVLLVAIAGGTNTGKSSVLNRLVGANVSTVSHKAFHTKHSTAVGNPAIAKIEFFKRNFPTTQVMSSDSPDLAADEVGDVHRLLFKTITAIPKDLVVIDTADFDSVNRNNWAKGYLVAQASDVLIAVINQAKCADDAVVSFFRKANEAGKPVIVVVNGVGEEQRKRGYWKDWHNQFCAATGIKPYKSYVVPDDIVASEERRQLFYEIGPNLELATTPTDLREDVLRKMDVAELRASAQRGALRNAIVGDGNGVGGGQALLNATAERTKRYVTANQNFRQNETSKKLVWPSVPAKLLQKTVRTWWDRNHRTAFVKFTESASHVLGFVGRFLTRGAVGDGPDLLREYRIDEERAVQSIVASMMGALNPLLEEQRDLLSLEARSSLTPDSVGRITAEIQAEYIRTRTGEISFDQVMAGLMPAWEKEHPSLVTLLHSLDIAANGFLKPVVTVTAPVALLFATSGVATLGAFLTHFSSHMAADGAAGAAGAVGSNTVAGGMLDIVAKSRVEKFFSDVNNQYGHRNTAWVLSQLVDKLPLVFKELEEGTKLTDLEPYKAATQCGNELLAWADLQGKI